LKKIIQYLQIPLQFAKQKAKRIVIPGFQEVNLFQVIQFLFKQLNTIGLYDRASAISFNLIMALPAGFLFLFSIIPYFPKSLKIKKQILSIFKDISPNSSTYRFILDIINDLLSQHVGIFSFGFLLLLFYDAKQALLSTPKNESASFNINFNVTCFCKSFGIDWTGSVNNLTKRII
jgi:membrane protein